MKSLTSTSEEDTEQHKGAAVVLGGIQVQNLASLRLPVESLSFF